MTKAETIQLLAAARCNLAEIMAATGCRREYCCQFAPQLEATPKRQAGPARRNRSASR